MEKTNSILQDNLEIVNKVLSDIRYNYTEEILDQSGAEKNNKNGKYIPHKNMALATLLAQKAYDAELLKELKLQPSI